MGTASNQILAFDYGEKRIGVAVGQTITASANPIQALAAKSGEPDWQLVQKLIDELQLVNNTEKLKEAGDTF